MIQIENRAEEVSGKQKEFFDLPIFYYSKSFIL